MANDLLFSEMKKAGKKILRLLMLLWKNYGAGKPAAIQTRPDSAPLVSGSDRIAAQAMAHFPPPCFSHKTLRGLFLCGSDGVMERGSELTMRAFRL